MNNREYQLPFYARSSIFLIGLVLLTIILYFVKDIIVPLVFSIIIAIVLHPFVSFQVKHKINRILAISISLLVTFIILASFAMLVFSQARQFSESWPILVERFTDLLNQFISGISGYLGVDSQNIHEWLTKSIHELLNLSNEAIGNTLMTVGSGVVVMLLLPVYIFLLLFYEPLILDFIRRLSEGSNQGQISEIVTQTKTVVQRYLIGLIVETVLVATLQIITLFTLGIEYAILLGIIGALLNLVPYLGGIVAVALPMMVALVTKTNGWYPIYILIIYYVIQLIDNNYFVPVIVASKVKINALFSIIAVIVGNSLWGIPGMFLSIPVLAIVKLIFDHIESLKPWGFLLGDTMPPLLNIKPIRLLRIKHPHDKN
jgi:predicted PurR-regulated permease PerM